MSHEYIYIYAYSLSTKFLSKIKDIPKFMNEYSQKVYDK